MRKVILSVIFALALTACMQGGGKAAGELSGEEEQMPVDTVEVGTSLPAPPPSRHRPTVKPFPEVQVPSVCSGENERLEYMVEHFWDRYFKGGGRTDSATVLGVRKSEVEQAFSNYAALLDNVPMSTAQKSVASLFDKLEAEQARDSTALTYLQFTEIVSKYLYDPNSPLRNEDYYLPFVKRMAVCRFTRDDMVPAYRFEAKMCAMNQYGTVAPDFQFRTLEGKVHSLHSIKAEYTMLFFSNPYCESCKSIIQDVMTRRYMNDYITNGRVAVVNVYIDEEVDKWREYAHNYPRNWYSGYDFLFKIRNDEDYNVRAIPSLYLLDKDKRVIMKDAPTGKVLGFLDRI